MTRSRIERWVWVSHRLGTVEPFMTIYVQQLGRLDCQLIDTDRWVLANFHNPTGDEADLLRLNDHLAMSHLWILGIYEVIRTLHQRLGEHDQAAEIGAVKKRLNELRVPLAKMEAAGDRSGQTRIAYPMLNLDHGAAWQLSETKVITRLELSELVLSCFEAFSAQYQEPSS